jgi:sugar lactone lactonase YvrE
MKNTFVVLCAAATLASNSFAVETKYWQENGQADFEKGSLKSVSLRSDGRLSLAPEVAEVYDTSVPYLWAIARDSKGNTYTGGGSSGGDTTKVFVIPPGGKSRVLAAVPGLEIHSIALNRRDEVFVATNPDGRVYRIGRDGKPVEFFNPRTRYIWAMAFDSHGNLYVATGDEGLVFRVAPDGKSAKFFDTQDTHARSLAIDRDDNILIGTDPSGLILRVSPSGIGFVLYQAARKEITALAVSPSGAIYAAGNGTKTPTVPVAPPSAPAPAPPVAVGQVPVKMATPSAPTLPLGPPTLAGGSEVYRIDPDGVPHRVWTSPQSLVYTISFDPSGLPLLGTGNSGRVYRLDNDVLSTVLLEMPPTQITAFVPGPGGVLYAATGNIGKVYRIGPGLAKSGTYESDVFDAAQFSRWGRLSIDGTAAVSTRSGNINRTQNNWSPWAPVVLEPDPGCASCTGGKVTSPAARFVQYKLEFTASGSLSEVDVAYLPRNVAPAIEEIEIAPANYRFPAPSAPPPVSQSPSTLTLPALGMHRQVSVNPVVEPASTAQTLTYSKGTIGARWAAIDENGDPLIYRVEIRGLNEPNWLLLKDKVREKYLDIDSTAFPDGEYELRVTASDEPGNPEGEALTATLVSEPFLIDNTPPVIGGLTAERSAPGIHVRWHAQDAKSNITRAEFSVNGGEWKLVAPVGGLSDSPQADYDVTIPGGAGAVIAVRVTDDFDNYTVRSVLCR